MTLEEQKELTNLLDNASKEYYLYHNEVMPDDEFDYKLKELQKAEKDNNYKFPNSPTLRVGSDLKDGFGKITHPVGHPMLTIENVYSTDELITWIKKMAKQYHEKKFNLSLKYDGISCELHYSDGVLVSAATRGDKIVGDDITDNVRTIKDVPLSIPFNKCDVYVRGEILLPKSQLIRINQEREANGEKPFSNCRNACSGSVKQLDSKITASRKLIFRAWDLFAEDNKVLDFVSQTEKFEMLKNFGFQFEEGTEPITIFFTNDAIANQASLVVIDKLWERAKKQDYDCDGVVLKADDIIVQRNIGTKDTRAIEWGMARKWNEEYSAETELLKVEWSVGRNNVTPVGILEPVNVGGVEVSNVTLHNISFIENLDLHIGNTVMIYRSGGVIPYLCGVKHDLLMEMNGAYPKVVAPTVCPSCGKSLVRDGEFLKCANEYCPARMESYISLWCQKDCMDIPQVGPALIKRLIETKLVEEPLDLYILNVNHTKEELVEILGDGYGIKTVQTLLDNIEKSKTKPLEKAIYGFGIDGVGKMTAKLLVDKFKTLDAIRCACKEDLMSIEGIGDVTADNIGMWMARNGKVYMEFMERVGLAIEVAKENVPEDDYKPLEGLKIVFTGKSEKFNGDDVEKYLERRGAKCSHSVTGAINYLVTGKKPGGSKVKKAQELGIKIIEESEFFSTFAL